MSGIGPLARRELLTSTSDTWSTNHADPLLNTFTVEGVAIDGKIYVVGSGVDLQIYDVASDVWTLGPMLPFSVTAPGVAVRDEQLFVFAGSTSDPGAGGDLSSVLTFDPATNRWTRLFSLQSSRSWPAVAAFDDGFVVAGGFDLLNVAVDDVEVFRFSR